MTEPGRRRREKRGLENSPENNAKKPHFVRNWGKVPAWINAKALLRFKGGLPYRERGESISERPRRVLSKVKVWWKKLITSFSLLSVARNSCGWVMCCLWAGDRYYWKVSVYFRKSVQQRFRYFDGWNDEHSFRCDREREKHNGNFKALCYRFVSNWLISHLAAQPCRANSP